MDKKKLTMSQGEVIKKRHLAVRVNFQKGKVVLGGEI
jgi:hypothetical protein